MVVLVFTTAQPLWVRDALFPGVSMGSKNKPSKEPKKPKGGKKDAKPKGRISQAEDFQEDWKGPELNAPDVYHKGTRTVIV